MKIKQAVKIAEKMISDHAPAILTSVGIVGTVATAVLAGKASFKANELIRQEEGAAYPIDRPGIAKDRALLIWKLYIPAVTTGAFTCGAIFFSNKISMKRAAAMASAFSITDRAYSEYKDKVQEHLGKPKEEKLRAEIAKDRMKKNPHQGVIPEEQTLFYDMWSGRYFYNTLQGVKTAVNDLNHQVIHYSYASLSDLYNSIGLQPTKNSDDIGWSSDKLLKVKYSTVTSEDQRPCFAIDFEVVPKKDYFRNH